MREIPIKNIYYMLCYAWNTLQQADEALVGNEKFDNICNLMARVLISGINHLLKRGFHREYVKHSEELSILRGKIDISGSIKCLSFNKNKLICEYDEFNEDVLFNQILKETIGMLIKYPLLNSFLRQELIKLQFHFSGIAKITLSKNSFSCLRYNRNNIHYKMLMNICELIFSGLVTIENGNTIKFADFIRDSQMAVLYEKFILNFYKKHLSETNIEVHSTKILWDYDEAYDNVGLEYLPDMRTDIVLDNRLKNMQLIIDTKFYASAMGKRNYSETRKLLSDNLYQIYAYIHNSKFNGTVSGLLLYPTTEHEMDYKYRISGCVMMVKTIDLTADWNDIYYRLMEIPDMSNE